MGKHAKTIVVEERILWLYSKDTDVWAEQVVKDAMDKKSPLHDNAGFEWDIKKAAYANWIAHARALIASVTLVTTTVHETFKTPIFIRNPMKAANVQGYISVADCAKNPVMARKAIDAEIEQCLSRLERLRALAKALHQERRVEAAMKQICKLQQALAA
jgi:heme exporter protein D